MNEKLFLLLAQLGDCGDLGLPGCDLKDGGGGGLSKALSNVFIVAGAVSVLFILIGGFRFVISSGDPNAVKQAKDTILYAVIGLVISLFAFAIVNYVLDIL